MILLLYLLAVSAEDSHCNDVFNYNAGLQTVNTTDTRKMIMLSENTCGSLFVIR